jgi:hypothetical protein
MFYEPAFGHLDNFFLENVNKTYLQDKTGTNN